MKSRIAAALACLAFVVPAGADAETPFERPQDAERELVDERTPMSRTWAMSSGEQVSQITQSPVQWEDAQGNWHSYNSALSRAGESFVAQSGQTEIAMPAELESARDTVDLTGGEGAQLSMRLIGARGEAEKLADGVIVYEDALPGADLRLQVVPEGVKEDILLGGPSASRDLVYLLRVGGDSDLRGDGRGGLLVEQAGKPIFTIPPPLLIDAAGMTSSNAGFSPIRRSEHEWQVSIVLDDDWLDAAERVWPVNVDPTVNRFVDRVTEQAADCQIMIYAYGGIGECTGPDRTVGGGWTRMMPSAQRMASFASLRFSTLTTFQNDAIESATLRLNRLASSTPNLTPLTIIPRGSTNTRSPYFAEAHVSPGPSGPIEADVTEAVTAWRDWTLSGGTRGMANEGFLLSHVRSGTWLDSSCALTLAVCDWTRYTSSRYTTDPSLHPVLEVRSWPTAPVGSAIISPEEGDLSGRFVRLQARALHSSVTGVQFQYIAGDSRRWTDIPAVALRRTNRESVASSTIPVSGPTGDRRSEMVVWDLAATPGAAIDGPVHVRAYLESTQLLQGGATPEVNIRADRTGVLGTAAASIGPGDVDLMTGEFSLGQTDVSLPAFLEDLALSRTYTSRGVPSRNAGMFGPGWEGNVDGDGGELPYKGVYNFSEIKREAIERYKLTPGDVEWENFNRQVATCVLSAEDEETERACYAMRPTIPYTEENLSTIKEWEYRYAVVEFSDGTKARFTQTVNPEGQVTGWVPDADMAGYRIEHHETSTPGIWEFVLTEPDGGMARFRSEITGSPNYRITSYQEPGSTSDLSYTYEPSGNRQRLKRVTAPYPTGGTPRWIELNWADVGNRNLRVVSARIGSGSGTGTTIAQYGYNARGRLLSATDPRTGLATQYVYDTRGLLSEVRPPGEEEWRLSYDQVSGDAGYRLTSVSRDHPDGGVATQTVRYQVPLSGPEAPYDMSATETARWGQTDDLPWQAVAIFPEDDVPAASNVDYRNTTIHYLDLDGREVNVAEPGGHITTTEYDAHGNVIRELTATNRQRALEAGPSSATVAHDLSSLAAYNGLDLIGTYEPRTEITLSDGTVVTGRRFTTTHYDQHLPTQRWRGVEISPGNRADERQTVQYGYDSLGGMSGWTARHATTTTLDPAGERLTTYRILHPNYPVVEETRRPRGAAGGARPDVRFYQYAGIIPSSRVPAALKSTTACEPNTPSGFLCMDSEATAPDASVPRRWYAYDPLLGVQTDLWESKGLAKTGAPVRRTQTVYTAGRATSVSVTGGQGSPVPTTTFTYSPATGRRVAVATAGQGTISSAYDANGRLVQYTDASGLVTRYAYDLRGRETRTTEDGNRVVRFDYDARDNLVSVADPDLPGEITATYDPDGSTMMERLPNGLQARYAYDETGSPRSVIWEQTTNCVSDCVRARSVIDGRDADGRITGHRAEGENETYDYDRVGRLAQVDTNTGAVCVRQQFVYDASYNRTGANTMTSAPNGDCGTGTTNARTWSHDSADRVTTTGWIHDDFGRATSVPAPDSGGRGILTAGYYTNDLVRQLSLDGRTHTYDRDPLGRTTTVNSTGGTAATVTTTNRYADGSDAPVVTTRSGGSAVREISGPTGTLVALKDGTRLDYQISDLLGNIIATVPASASDGRPTKLTTYDPFGTVTSDAPNVIDWTTGTPGYGWLGAHQRSTEFEQVNGAGPPMEMGVRVYLPGAGRFLQRDPIEGGSANPYEYGMQDPVNQSDLSGAYSCQSMIGSAFCAIDDWIDRSFKKATQPATWLFHKCIAGSGWGAVLSIGTYIGQTKDTIGRLLRDLRYQRGRMDHFTFARKGIGYRRAARKYGEAKFKLGEMGKAARLGTGIGIAGACIEGVFDFAWPL